MRLTLTAQLVAGITSQNIADSGGKLGELLQAAESSISGTGKDIETFIRHGLRFFKDDEQMLEILCSLQAIYKTYKIQMQPGVATHRDKRQLINGLGIRTQPYSAADLLRKQNDQPDAQFTEQPVRIIFRERDKSATMPWKTMMVDEEIPGTFAGARVVNESTGYYVVKANESVIFVSESEPGKVEVELAVIRGVACTPGSEPFFKWLTAVVNHACNDRRDVRGRSRAIPRRVIDKSTPRSG
ncbi:hypothetical protein BD410DRAFT_810004, partial [Rickenella mellea]